MYFYPSMYVMAYFIRYKSKNTIETGKLFCFYTIFIKCYIFLILYLQIKSAVYNKLYQNKGVFQKGKRSFLYLPAAKNEIYQTGKLKRGGNLL